MKVGFSTPNVQGSAPAALAATPAPASSNASKGAALSTSTAQAPPQAAAPSASTAMNSPVSGSAIAPPPDVSMARMKISELAANTIASQNASATQSAAQPSVLAALLALKRGHAAPPITPIQQAGAATVPAAVLPQNPLTLLKDTAKSPAVLQIPQQAGMGQNPTMRIVSPSPVLLLQQLLDASSAFRNSQPNVPISQAGATAPEKLAARGSALSHVSQLRQDNATGVTARHFRVDPLSKFDPSTVSARFIADLTLTESNLRHPDGLRPERQGASMPVLAQVSTRLARTNNLTTHNESLMNKAPLPGVMQGKLGGTMLSPEGLNMMARPNTVYVEGAAAGVRVEPEQARLLGLRAGETITAVVTQRQDGNVLLVGKQQLPIPDRMNLPPGQVSLLVRVISGQPVLALTDPALAAQVAAAHQRTDSDGRFARLLNHVGSFHLSRLFSPDYLPTLAAQAGAPQIQRGLASMLLDSSKLDSGALRQMVQNMGLFGEHQASLNPGQAAPGIKSMLLTLRALMQARQMETTSLSGAIDEIEARQLDSLAQQAAGRTHYSWVIPFADQHPVFIELEHNDGSDAEGALAQESWTVDLEVGLTKTVSMAANVRVDQEGVLSLRLWLPEPTFYRLAEAGKTQLETMLSGQGLSLGGLIIYPVARDAGSVSYRQQRMGVSIDA